jgi:transcriptional regulator with XRE-family HTH domain
MSLRTLRARLQYARKLKGKSASGLDAEAKLTRGHTWQIETGRKPRIELETATKLATALGVSLDWLVSGIGDGPAKRPTKSVA